MRNDEEEDEEDAPSADAPSADVPSAIDDDAPSAERELPAAAAPPPTQAVPAAAVAAAAKLCGPAVVPSAPAWCPGGRMAAKAFGHSPRATASTARQAVRAAHRAAESEEAETNVSPETPERLRASGGRRRLGCLALAAQAGSDGEA